MATIKDIARHAGVSIATVSMVLNNKDGISQKTREHVERAAKELNYVPSAAAKALKTNRSYTLGLMVGNIMNPYFLGIINGVEEVARKHNYHIHIANIGNDIDSACNSIDGLVQQGVDGIIITWTQLRLEKIIKRLHEAMNKGIRVIALTEAYEGYDIPFVSVDETKEIEVILTKLVALRHKNIGFIGGTKDTWMTTRRFNLYKKILEEYDVFNENYVAYGGYTVEQGKLATIDLITKYPEITALMAITDTIAIGAMQALRDLQISVPDEMSLFGIDGIEYTRYFAPRITTIDAQANEIGTTAARKLIGAIEASSDVVETYIGCNIIEGETIGKVPKSRMKE